MESWGEGTTTWCLPFLLRGGSRFAGESRERVSPGFASSAAGKAAARGRRRDTARVKVTSQNKQPTADSCCRNICSGPRTKFRRPSRRQTSAARYAARHPLTEKLSSPGRSHVANAALLHTIWQFSSDFIFPRLSVCTRPFSACFSFLSLSLSLFSLSVGNATSVHSFASSGSFAHCSQLGHHTDARIWRREFEIGKEIGAWLSLLFSIVSRMCSRSRSRAWHANRVSRN